MTVQNKIISHDSEWKTYLWPFNFMVMNSNSQTYYTHFEITGGPCNLIGCNWCDLFTNRTIFALNRIFFPANEEATLKTKQPIRFQGFFKVTDQLQENERQRVPCGKFCNFCFPNSYFFPPKNWMNLISNRLSIASIKYFNWLSPVFGQFQNGCNWTLCRAILVWNHTCDFWRLSI